MVNEDRIQPMEPMTTRYTIKPFIKRVRYLGSVSYEASSLRISPSDIS